jgi:hypothetical protein
MDLADNSPDHFYYKNSVLIHKMCIPILRPYLPFSYLSGDTLDRNEQALLAIVIAGSACFFCPKVICPVRALLCAAKPMDKFSLTGDTRQKKGESICEC